MTPAAASGTATPLLTVVFGQLGIFLENVQCAALRQTVAYFDELGSGEITTRIKAD